MATGHMPSLGGQQAGKLASVEARRIGNALRKLRLRDLETLDCLDRTRSFARTAEAVSITQPALSKWLRELEEALGVLLFERTSRRVAPTVYGEAMLEFIGRMLTDAHNLGPSLEALRQGGNQRVTVGMLPNMSSTMMPETLVLLQKRRAQVQVNVRENTLDQLLAMLRQRELDLLVCRLDAMALSAGFPVEKLFRDEVIVVCGAKHPLRRRKRLSWHDAAAFPWIAPPQGSPARLALETEFALAGTALPSVLMESVSSEAGRAVAERLPCLFMQSSWAFQFRTHQGDHLCRLPLKVSSIPETIGFLYSTPLSVAAHKVAEVLKEAVQLQSKEMELRSLADRLR